VKKNSWRAYLEMEEEKMFDWMKWQDLLHFFTPAQLSAGSGRRNLSQAVRTIKALISYVFFLQSKATYAG
jgi:hypothetical protein